MIIHVDEIIDIISLNKRFWKKIIRTENCWIWTAATNDVGYGQIYVNKKLEYAHRISYILRFNQIPSNFVIDHLCRNPTCVNPDHLEPVTTKENIMRGTSFMASNHKKTHCVHGHEYTEENTVRRKDRIARNCRRCKNLRDMIYRQKRKTLS